MKLFSVLAVVGAILATANAIDLTTVKNEIVPNCLNRLYDPQRPSTAGIRPLASSVENFISLVEKIERNHTSWDIYKVSKVLLKRFSFDGIIFSLAGQERTPQQDQHTAIRSDIIDAVLPFRKEETDVFDEKDLSEEEKCSMFFMLSHLMNDTYIEGLDEELVQDNQASDPQAHSYHAFSGNSAKKAKSPREQGVVSLNGHQHHAIALGKVLLGIVAAQKQAENHQIGNLFSYLKEKLTEFDGNLKINPLFGVTLGDVVAHAALSAGHDTTAYGIGGHWNNSACTSVYKMSQHTYGSTRALVAGAIDGVLIGKRLSTMNGNSRTLTLSKVLRMYYSRDGIPVENSGTSISFCRRNDFRSVTGSNDLVESITAYYHVYYAKEFSSVDLTSQQKATDSLSKLENIVGVQMNIDEQFCRIQSSDKEKCETRSNIFIVLDDSEARTEGFHLQEQTIGFLSNYFDIGYGGSTLSVLSNSRGGNNNLRPVSSRSYNATNKAAATCAISRLDGNGNGISLGQSLDEENLMHALNGTLQDFELKVAEESYAPSKVVVVFKYSDLQLNDDARIERAANLLRYGHRDTRVITVGNNAENLKKLATDVRDVITGIDRPEDIAAKLAPMICEVPSVLQYDQCYNRRTRNEQNNVHIGYVTPEYTQYIAMYPQYFLKSRHIQFKFNTEGSSGDLVVCFSRTDASPKEGEQNIECRTSGVDGIRELIFQMRDPCHKYNVYNCPPAYFSVTGKRKSTDKARCTDENCRRLDQIKFTFSHEGVYCSGCLSLLSSPFTVFVLFSTFLFKLLRNW